MTRVRIPISNRALTRVMIAALVAMSVLSFASAYAAPSPRIVAVYNQSPIATTLHVVNTTSVPVPLPRPCEMTTCAHPQIEPHGVRVYATSGSGPLTVNFDDALTVQTEFASPYAILRVDPCVPLDEAYFHDLIPPGTLNFNSGVYVGAIDRDVVASVVGGDQVSIPAGQARILPNTAALGHLVTVTGSGKVCTFAYGNSALSGSLFVVYPH